MGTPYWRSSGTIVIYVNTNLCYAKNSETCDDLNFFFFPSNIIFVCPIRLPLFLFFTIVCVIASIAYIHPVYGGWKFLVIVQRIDLHRFILKKTHLLCIQVIFISNFSKLCNQTVGCLPYKVQEDKTDFLESYWLRVQGLNRQQ
jgi:hypothetical protein